MCAEYQKAKGLFYVWRADVTALSIKPAWQGTGSEPLPAHLVPWKWLLQRKTSLLWQPVKILFLCSLCAHPCRFASVTPRRPKCLLLVQQSSHPCKGGDRTSHCGFSLLSLRGWNYQWFLVVSSYSPFWATALKWENFIWKHSEPF